MKVYTQAEVSFFCMYLCLFGALFAGKLEAREIYVSPKGVNNAEASYERPCKTISYALLLAKHGDTVFLREGVYNEALVIEDFKGSNNAYLTIRPYKSEKAAISGKNLPEERYESLVTIRDSAYFALEGVELTNFQTFSGAAFCVEGVSHHISIRNCEIHEIRGGGQDGGAMGIAIYGTNKSFPIEYITIENNHVHNCDPATSETIVVNGNVRKFLIKGNHVHDVNNIGIDMIGGEKWIGGTIARDGECINNRVERARSSYGGGYASGIYIDGGQNIRLEGNVVQECDIGISVGCENAGYVVEGISVVNNTICNNEKAGLMFGGYQEKLGRVMRCEFRNNNIRANDTLNAGFGQVWVQYAKDNSFSHNTVSTLPGRAFITSWWEGADNKFDYNKYLQKEGAPLSSFIWRGEEYGAFPSFQKHTLQEANGSFGFVEELK